ncbi:hypothetical protein G6L37_04205 [Agrobacterium rubi]|nr:hypothetical protein [Agrobacterium rubi]NTF24554.1 hypothetical protein [Agrobacterium rubi]
MPNMIIVGQETHEICADYIQGALHARVGLKSLFKDNGTEQWRVGQRNEQGRQHLRFDTDILTETDTGRVFEEDPEYGATEKVASRYGTQFVMSYGNFRRDLLIACGAYHAQGQITEERGSLNPGDMRKALAERGIWISTDDCALLSRLRYDEARAAEATLTEEEIEAIEKLREPQRRLLEICSDLKDQDWSSSPETDVVSWKAKRSSGWSTATAGKMQVEGLVRATGNGWIDITPKGILAVKHLRARDAEMGLEGLPPVKATGRSRW